MRAVVVREFGPFENATLAEMPNLHRLILRADARDPPPKPLQRFPTVWIIQRGVHGHPIVWIP